MADVTASIVEQEVIATVDATEISATLVNDGAVNIVTELEVGPAGPPGPRARSRFRPHGQTTALRCSTRKSQLRSTRFAH